MKYQLQTEDRFYELVDYVCLVTQAQHSSNMKAEKSNMMKTPTET